MQQPYILAICNASFPVLKYVLNGHVGFSGLLLGDGQEGIRMALFLYYSSLAWGFSWNAVVREFLRVSRLLSAERAINAIRETALGEDGNCWSSGIEIQGNSIHLHLLL